MEENNIKSDLDIFSFVYMGVQAIQLSSDGYISKCDENLPWKVDVAAYSYLGEDCID